MVNKKGELLLDPGDLWDRITILDIKIQKLSQNPEAKKFDKKKGSKLGIVKAQYDRAKQLVDKLIRATGLMDFVTLSRLITELRDSNEKQWDLEDRVRTENSWEAAKAARDNNSDRVKIKNKINELYGFPTEVKQYAGE